MSPATLATAPACVLYAIPPLTLAASEHKSVREGQPDAFVSVSIPRRFSEAAGILPGLKRDCNPKLRTREKERAATAGWNSCKCGSGCIGSLLLDDDALATL